MIFLRSKGIIISKKDIGEADRYITIFLEDFGKVSGVINGIRKSKRRDKIAADILSLTDFSFYKKNENIVISGFSSIDNYNEIRKDMVKLNLTLYIFSILNQILVENGKNRELYNLLEKTLNYLNKSENKKNNLILVLFFISRVIIEEGINTNFENLFLDSKKYSKDKISKKEKEIVNLILENKVKEIINNEEYEKKDIGRVILIFENYINYNLDTYIDIKRFLWGDMLW